jgi:hypothetical protein
MSPIRDSRSRSELISNTPWTLPASTVSFWRLRKRKRSISDATQSAFVRPELPVRIDDGFVRDAGVEVFVACSSPILTHKSRTTDARQPNACLGALAINVSLELRRAAAFSATRPSSKD